MKNKIIDIFRIICSSVVIMLITVFITGLLIMLTFLVWRQIIILIEEIGMMICA